MTSEHLIVGTVKQRVIFLVLGGVELLDLAGSAQVFSMAASLGAPYSLHFCVNNPVVRSAQGLFLGQLEPLPSVCASDMVMVAGVALDQLNQPVLDYDTRRWLIDWQAVLQRDPNFEELIFYGVRSTKIYCRPTCPSRKPNRHQVYFFDSAQAAEAAGYRPCKRCEPQHVIAPNSNIAKVLVICRYLDVHVEHIPTLAQLGHYVGMSPTHLQRSFKQIIGVTPFQYADARRIERFKQRIQQGNMIADALYETGYGASSRLYEKAPKQLGMTPAVYQRLSQGECIRYTIVQSPLLIAPRGSNWARHLQCPARRNCFGTRAGIASRV